MLIVKRSMDFGGVAFIRNLPNPVSSGDAVNLAHLNSELAAVASAAEKMAWKDNVVVSTQANIDLSAPGATIDGVTMQIGNRFLVRAQTTTSQNGIYVWNGAAVPATRALDATTGDELTNAIVPVDSGSDAGLLFRQTAAQPVIDTDPITFASFATSAPAATETSAGIVELATQSEVNTGTDTTRVVTPATLAGSVYAAHKYATDIGDGSATSIAVTHNLNSRDVHVSVLTNSGNYDDVLCEVRRNSVNQVTIVFDVAPSSNEYRVIVIG
jgi:hypothetical protein